MSVLREYNYKKIPEDFHEKEVPLFKLKGFPMIILLLGPFLFLYWPVFSALAGQWWSNDMYSYGFLIPIISLYLVWIKRRVLEGVPLSPAILPGSIFILLSLFLLIVGHAGGILILQEFSILTTITGLILYIFGFGYLKILFFPIAYLLLMIPIWNTFTDPLHLPFQKFSANIGVLLLQSIHIPAYRYDIYIELPRITLEVARTCSGVNYLIAVIAVGIPLAYIYLRSWPRRILLITIAVLISIGGNSLRVAMIGALAYFGWNGPLHGPYHVLQALFVSYIGFLALFIGVNILREKSFCRWG